MNQIYIRLNLNLIINGLVIDAIKLMLDLREFKAQW